MCVVQLFVRFILYSYRTFEYVFYSIALFFVKTGTGSLYFEFFCVSVFESAEKFLKVVVIMFNLVSILYKELERFNLFDINEKVWKT